jgi:hypothetical protein
MIETSDLVIFWAVVAARFLIPLAIPRYPLPAILIALIVDIVDNDIFKTFTNLPLEGYQGYDKALDIYYLAIAYISTMRNWKNPFAFKLNAFLFYYRMVGVTLFEITQLRPLMLIFPNTFEYFFIFYEVFRLKWDPRQLTKGQLIAAAAAIWIFIKLPMEWWIHIAHIDTMTAISENIGTLAVLSVVVIIVFIVIGRRLQRFPPAQGDQSVKAGLARLKADPPPNDLTSGKEGRKLSSESERFFNRALIEKIVLVSFLCIIFAQVLSEAQATNLQIIGGVAFIIVINAVLSQWLARRGTEWRSILQQFIVMAMINFGLVLFYVFLLPRFDGSINLGNTLFFVLLLTLIVTLYNLYRPIYVRRFAANN